MDAAVPAIGFGARCKRLLHSSYTLMYGLMLATISADELFTSSLSHSPWRYLLMGSNLVLLLWLLATPPGFSGWSTLSREDAVRFAIAVAVGLAVWLVKAPWSVGLVALAFAVLWILVGRIRRRNFYLAASGWYLAGLAVVLSARRFTAVDQFSMLGFLGGIVTALQGAWDFLFRHAPVASDEAL